MHTFLFAKIEEWSRRHDKQTFLNEPALLKHKKMFDIMKYTKEGFAKENTFLPWCRKINKLRIQVASTATEHAESSTATEHAESPEDPETRWFKALALDLLSNETEHGSRRIPQ